MNTRITYKGIIDWKSSCEAAEAENAKLKAAAKALLDTYCDETYEALKALVEDK